MKASIRLPLAATIACAVAVAHADEVALDPVFASGFEAATPTAFRMGALALRDPHLFFPFATFCIDSTEALNDEIAQQLDADEDGDGFYDTSPLALFRPFATGLPTGFENRSGICDTSATPHCVPGIDPPVQRWARAFDVSPPTVCAGPLPDTVSGFDPPVPAPGGNCFATTIIDATFALSTLELPLWDTKFAAPWPSTSGSTGGGLVRGFLRESDADQLSIDLGAGPVVLSSMLPDGTGSCATGDPQGKDIDRGEPGWWMYLEFRLDAVTSSGF
ncbi:MAG: hypothetical protein ACREPX_06995 [Rhodanobacteraceae bacterium]